MELARTIEALPQWRELGGKYPSALLHEKTPASGAVEANAGASEALPSNAPARGRVEVKTLKDAQQNVLNDLFVIQALPSSLNHGNKVAVFAVASQVVEPFQNMVCSQVTLQVTVLPSSTSHTTNSSAPAAGTSVTLTVEVLGYDVEKSGIFRQLVVGSSCRGLLLVSPRCCAAVALPDLCTVQDAWVGRAVPLVPPDDAEFVKVLWHPLSDAHVGVLLNNFTWQLLNLSHRASVIDPEVHFPIKFGESTDIVVDFTFGVPGNDEATNTTAGETTWLAMAVLFLSASGRVSIRSPVLPAVALFPSRAIEALRVAAAVTSSGLDEAPQGLHADLKVQDWLRRTLLCPSNCHEVDMIDKSLGSFTRVRHNMHLHGNGEIYRRHWMPAEQVIKEDIRSDVFNNGEASPRSRSSRTYCSLQHVAHSPISIVARAASTGFVEFIINNAPLGPRFEMHECLHSDHEIACSIFEEVDLVLSPSKSSTVRLLPAFATPDSLGPVILARSRSLVAAIELPWVKSLLAGAGTGTSSLPSAAVTTLAEIKMSEGPSEIMGWQFVHANARPAGKANGSQIGSLVGLFLRAKGHPSATSSGSTPPVATLHSVDITAALLATATARASKQGGETAGIASDLGSKNVAPATEREEYLRYLSAPMVMPSQLFGAPSTHADPAALAQAVASVQGAQLAGLEARCQVLQHLHNQVPKRVAFVRAELVELGRSGDRLLKQTSDCKAKVQSIKERQKDLERQYKSIVDALATELEMRELSGVAAEELPKLWSHVHELRQAFELMRAASLPTIPTSASASAASPPPQERLATVEELQKVWTDTSARHLTAQAAELEVVVAKASKRHFEMLRLAEEA